MAVLNFGKRTTWTSKTFLVLPAMSVVGESRSEFMSSISLERGKIKKKHTKLVYIILYFYGLASKFY